MRRALDAVLTVVCWLALLAVFWLLFLGGRAEGDTRHMVTMYDAGFGNAPKIPSTAQAVAGHGFTPALWARWPRAAHVTIAHSPTDYSADVVDFEPGGGWVWGIPNLRTWLKGHQAATGRPGTVYVNAHRIWMVQAAAAGLKMPWIWAMDQTGSPHMFAGPNVIATQWWGSVAARRAGQPWSGVDVSEVANLGDITGRGGGSAGGSGGLLPPPLHRAPRPVPVVSGWKPGLGHLPVPPVPEVAPSPSSAAAGLLSPDGLEPVPVVPPAAEAIVPGRAGVSPLVLVLLAGSAAVLLVVLAVVRRPGRSKR